MQSRYNQMMNNLTSQASTMNLGSTPNDIVAKLNPLFIVIVIPIMDFGIYPALRKAGVNCSYPQLSHSKFIADFACQSPQSRRLPQVSHSVPSPWSLLA